LAAKTPPNGTSPHARWTIEALKEYFEMRFNGLEGQLSERFLAQEKALKVAADEEHKLLDARFTSQEKAVVTALTANEKRLDGMNEIRSQLQDQATTFSTKAELKGLEALVALKLDQLNENVKGIQISDATLAGKATQGQLLGAYLVSGTGIVIGIIGIILRVIGN
jgi:hypothetical protein